MKLKETSYTDDAIRKLQVTSMVSYLRFFFGPRNEFSEFVPNFA